MATKRVSSQSVPEPLPDLGAGTRGPASEPHPAGKIKHGFAVQAIRMLASTTWLFTVIFSVHATQWLGSPLYFINRDYFYAFMALTKQSFGLLIITLTAWFSPTIIRGVKNLDHALLPRSTGLHFCLQELKGTVDWVYDCTVAYEGIPRGSYGQDIFTLRSTYFQGRPPKSVNMYWRRFATSSIPIEDPKQFEQWLTTLWREKDALIEQYVENGRFPADEGHDAEGEPAMNGKANSKVAKGAGFIETEVKLAHWYEIGQIFVVLAMFALVFNILAKIWNLVFYGDLVGRG
ncbi:hypothetical protein P7C71_g6307, partial [Lecanoromycetidae sp. Uapishka_2]